MRCHNAPPSIKGFTLVEISIVMIIIGLLISGIFGGMKLIDNANVQKTVQDIKAIESATLTFRDTYRALPGDIRTPSTRIPNCTVAPCATAGNGDRILDAAVGVNDAIVATNERFTFWHHLQASDLLSLGYRNTTDMNFGEGQPESPINGGYRITNYSGLMSAFPNERPVERAIIYHMPYTEAFQTVTGARSNTCQQSFAVDNKMDDGLPHRGYLYDVYCGLTTAGVTNYVTTGSGTMVYDFRGF